MAAGFLKKLVNVSTGESIRVLWRCKIASALVLGF